MAEHDVEQGDVGPGEQTLTATEIDTVTYAEDLNRVAVTCPTSSPADVWATFDGSDPIVGGGGSTLYVPAGSVRTYEPKIGGATVVKVISSGAAKYVVERDD